MHVVVEYILATTTIMERLSSYSWLEATLLDRNRHGTFHLRNRHWIALFIHERHTDFIKVCVVPQLIVVMGDQRHLFHLLHRGRGAVDFRDSM